MPTSTMWLMTSSRSIGPPTRMCRWESSWYLQAATTPIPAYLHLAPVWRSPLAARRTLDEYLLLTPVMMFPHRASPSTEPTLTCWLPEWKYLLHASTTRQPALISRYCASKIQRRVICTSIVG
uniref:Uncharacterized protein n=1 Tax=Oryza brachyantha TaxID=4533 RepID=J3N0P3_ORYBR